MAVPTNPLTQPSPIRGEGVLRQAQDERGEGVSHGVLCGEAMALPLFPGGAPNAPQRLKEVRHVFDAVY